MSEEQEKTYVPAVARCFKILRYIEQHEHVTIMELIKKLDLPKSSVYLLIEELKAQGAIKVYADGSIRLWMRLIDLGHNASDRLDIKEIVRPHLENLMESVDCIAVQFGIFDNPKAYYAIKLKKPNAVVETFAREGVEIPIAYAGTGKCLLAYQPENIRDAILASMTSFQSFTETSIKSVDELRKELARIRLIGWAMGDGEYEKDIKSLAVPVFWPGKERLFGALATVGLVNRYTKDKIPELIQMAQRCAHNIEATLASGS